MVEAGQREGKGNTSSGKIAKHSLHRHYINVAPNFNSTQPIITSCRLPTPDTPSTMFTALLRRAIPAQAGPSTRACSSSAKCSHSPVTPRAPLSTPTPLIRSMPSARIASPLSRSIFQLSNRISQSKAVSTSLMGQLRGMKVRSSVKKFCDGCSVVRR